MRYLRAQGVSGAEFLQISHTLRAEIAHGFPPSNRIPHLLRDDLADTAFPVRLAGNGGDDWGSRIRKANLFEVLVVFCSRGILVVRKVQRPHTDRDAPCARAAID